MFTLCSSLFCQNCDTTGSCNLDTVGSSETLNMSWQKEEGPYLWSFTEASKHLCSLLIVIIATCLVSYLIFHLCGVPTVFFHPEVRVTAAFHQIKPFPKARNEAYTTRRLLKDIVPHCVVRRWVSRAEKPHYFYGAPNVLMGAVMKSLFSSREGQFPSCSSLEQCG